MNEKSVRPKKVGKKKEREEMSVEEYVDSRPPSSLLEYVVLKAYIGLRNWIWPLVIGREYLGRRCRQNKESCIMCNDGRGY